MVNNELFLLEFLTSNPGVWSNRQLSDRLRLGESTVKKHIRSLRLQGRIRTSTERHSLRGNWWARRLVEVVPGVRS